MIEKARGETALKTSGNIPKFGKSTKHETQGPTPIAGWRLVINA